MTRCPVPGATGPLPGAFLVGFALLLVGPLSVARAQQPATTQPPPPLAIGRPARETAPSPPQARDQDVESVDAIVAAVYDVISGPAGEPRDWDRWASLFLPGARLVSVSVNAQGQTAHRTMTPEEYAELAGPAFAQTGFFESEIGRTEEAFGPVVQLFSAYASRRSPDDPAPFARGINSFQLMHDGSRWWVVTIFWTAERPDLPIPQRYLGGASG